MSSFVSKLAFFSSPPAPSPQSKDIADLKAGQAAQLERANTLNTTLLSAMSDSSANTEGIAAITSANTDLTNKLGTTATVRVCVLMYIKSLGIPGHPSLCSYTNPSNYGNLKRYRSVHLEERDRYNDKSEGSAGADGWDEGVGVFLRSSNTFWNSVAVESSLH